MYGGGNSGSNGRRSQGSRRTQQRYSNEEDIDEGSDYDSFNEGDFEMVSNRRPAPSTSGSVRSGSRRPDVRIVKIKIHHEDVRLLQVGTAIEFPDLVDRIRDKLELRRRFKIKVRDDDAPQSEMITMSDQDDWDMILQGVKAAARKKGETMARMDVSIFFGSFLPVYSQHISNQPLPSFCLNSQC
jgi:hypothetical protein